MTSTPTRRDVPAWVFVLVILLCLGGGIGFVVWFFTGSSPAARPVTLKSPEQLEAERRQAPQPERRRRARPADAAAPQARPAQPRAAQPAPSQPRPTQVLETINQRDDQRTYRVRGQVLTLDIVDHRTNPDRFNFRASIRGMLNDEQWELVQFRWRILRDPSVARYANVPDWQMQRLRAADPSAPPIPDEDRAKVAALWAELDPWSNPPPPEAQQRLLMLVNAIGARSQTAIRSHAQERVKQIGTILTAEQIAALKKMGTPEAKSPPAPPTPPDLAPAATPSATTNPAK